MGSVYNYGISRKCNEAGLAIIRHFEGLKTRAYRCPAGIWTIGYGHTVGVRRSDVCTKEQAERWLREDVLYAEEAVSRMVKVPLTDNQFSALVSFAYNVGIDDDSDAIPEGLGDSSLLKKLNRGDYGSVPASLRRWNKAGGRVLLGLVRRRAAEAALWDEST